MGDLLDRIRDFSTWMQDNGDPRVKDWLLASSPIPILLIFILYLMTIWVGPKMMRSQQPWNLNRVLVLYNGCLVFLSAYMFYEFLMSAYLAGYSLVCQPVDYSDDPLALRMASVCWWFFFSKVIELLDTVFFILRKKDSQITFLHVYHHCTMIINWYLGVKYIAGGQSFFLAMVNSFVHIIMYTYYALAAVGPHLQPYLWWKKYITKLQLSQFVIVIVHTGMNMSTDCDFPAGFNLAVCIYAFTLILLFSNFYYQTYVRRRKRAAEKESNGTQGIAYTNGHLYDKLQYDRNNKVSLD